jgi:hypothetical protein
MKFGRADEQYFVNDGESPTLYVTNGGYLENASAQNAKWYPFSQDFKYERPVYVGIAPSWPMYLSMGWYPGMSAYGGYWGYTPYGVGLFTPMIGLNFNIGGSRYNGWDNYSDAVPVSGPWAITNTSYPGFNNNAAFLGGVTLKSADKRQTLSVLTTSGNEYTAQGPEPADGSLVGNRSLISTVYTNALTDRLTYVFQNDNAWQFNAGPAYPGNIGQPGGLAQWYSFNQYLFWKFNEQWIGGVRLEYFRDNNGYKIATPLRNYCQAGNPGYYAGGFTGNFWEMTWGLNYRANRNWLIRPELRYDWFAPNAGVTARPYGQGLGQGIGTSGNQLGQLYGGCDAIFRF